jgi:hypothetical protein
VVTQLAEVLRPEPEQGSAVELGVAADVVVHLRSELVAVLVEPRFPCQILAAHEDGGRLPVVPLPWQIVAAFEQKDALPRWRESVDQRATTCSRADDDHVVIVAVRHALLLVG